MQENQQKRNQNVLSPKLSSQNIWKQCRKYIPYFVVVVGIVLTGVVYLISMEFSTSQGGVILDETANRFSSSEETVSDAQSQEHSIEDEENLSTVSESLETKSYIMVYVCGAVMKPDVYTLVEGSRLIDAIHAAGGFTEDAWREGINLARTIVDAEQIYVPTQEERLSGSITISNDADNDSGDSGISSSNSGKINLNTATKQQLMSLPGIGEAKADSIIAYRQQNGEFSSIEDIMNISGIKESVFDKIKDQITVK